MVARGLCLLHFEELDAICPRRYLYLRCLSINLPLAIGSVLRVEHQHGGAECEWPGFSLWINTAPVFIQFLFCDIFRNCVKKFFYSEYLVYCVVSNASSKVRFNRCNLTKILIYFLYSAVVIHMPAVKACNNDSACFIELLSIARMHFCSSPVVFVFFSV